MGSGCRMPRASWPDKQRAEGRWASNQVHAFFPLAFVHPSLSKHEPVVCLPLMDCVRGALCSRHLLSDRTSPYPPRYRGGSCRNQSGGPGFQGFQDCTDSSEVLAPCEEGERCLLAAALLTGGDLLNQIWKKKKCFFLLSSLSHS